MEIKQLIPGLILLLNLVYGEPALATEKQEMDKNIEAPDLLLSDAEKSPEISVVSNPLAIEQRDLSLTKPDLLEIEFKEKLKSGKDVPKGKQRETSANILDKHKFGKQILDKNRQSQKNKFSGSLLTDDPILEIFN